MPELPEVETVRRELATVLVGRRFLGVTVGLPKMLKDLTPARFRRALVGTTIRSVARRAKLLLIRISSGQTLMIHLKMSGQLIWRSANGQLRGGGHLIPGALDRLPNRYSHLWFRLTGGALYFNDLRQFGYLRLIPTDQERAWFLEQGYGPEIIRPTYSFADFRLRLGRRGQTRLKPLLLDQRFVAGLGNIYVDEALYHARLHPLRRSRSLSLSEQRQLFRSIRTVLSRAVAKGGTTLRFFRRPDGQPGGMRPFLKVYGRTGEPCGRCGSPVRKIRLFQRGTHLCVTCQPQESSR